MYDYKECCYVIEDAHKLYIDIWQQLKFSKKRSLKTITEWLPSLQMHGQNFDVWPQPFTLLMYCAVEGCADVAEYLLKDLKVNPNVVSFKENSTALHKAEYHRKKDVVSIL